MQSVNIYENNDTQREIIKLFSEKIREKAFCSKEDSDEVFNFFRKLIEIECDKYDISFQCEIKNNRLELLPQIVADNLPNSSWNSVEAAFCECSDTVGNDINFYFDPMYFIMKYFGKKEVGTRLDGIAELLITIYHQADYAVKLKGILRGYLSPEIFAASTELLLKEMLGQDFYKENHMFFSFEEAAEEYAHHKVLELVDGSDILDLVKNNISKKKIGKREFVFSKIGKIKYKGEIYSRNKLYNYLCENEINKHRNILYTFPIFEKKYNSDGLKKNLQELFDEMMQYLRKIIHKHSSIGTESSDFISDLEKEYADCQMFYYELISSVLETATAKDYNELSEKYGVISLQGFLSGMEKYFNTKVQEKLEYAVKYSGEELETSQEIKDELKKNINSIIRFRNGVILNPIADKLLREGGFVRGTREVLSRDVSKRRKMFAESLIGVYDAIESEDEYSKRADNEKIDIDEVINALYYNRFENFLKNVELRDNGEMELGKVEVVRTAQILKIAKILTLETGQDYFGEFLKIPDVNRLMMTFEKDKNGYLNECIKKSCIRFKKVIYPATEAEEGKYKNYILGLENTEDSIEIKNKVTMLNEEFAEFK